MIDSVSIGEVKKPWGVFVGSNAKGMKCHRRNWGKLWEYPVIPSKILKVEKTPPWILS